MGSIEFDCILYCISKMHCIVEGTCLRYLSTGVDEHFGVGDSLFSSLLNLPSIKDVFLVLVLEFGFELFHLYEFFYF